MFAAEQHFSDHVQLHQCQICCNSWSHCRPDYQISKYGGKCSLVCIEGLKGVMRNQATRGDWGNDFKREMNFLKKKPGNLGDLILYSQSLEKWEIRILKTSLRYEKWFYFFCCFKKLFCETLLILAYWKIISCFLFFLHLI